MKKTKKECLGVPRPKKSGSRASRATLRSGPAKKRGPSPSARSRTRAPFLPGDKVRFIKHHGGFFPFEGKETTVRSCERAKCYGGGYCVKVARMPGVEAAPYGYGSSWLELLSRPALGARKARPNGVVRPSSGDGAKRTLKRTGRGTRQRPTNPTK